MKRLPIAFLTLFLIAVLSLTFPIGKPVLNAGYQGLSIQSIICTVGLDPKHSPYLMLDDDPKTAWNTTHSSCV